jgi:hypothetical protein
MVPGWLTVGLEYTFVQPMENHRTAHVCSWNTSYPLMYRVSEEPQIRSVLPTSEGLELTLFFFGGTRV